MVALLFNKKNEQINTLIIPIKYNSRRILDISSSYSNNIIKVVFYNSDGKESKSELSNGEIFMEKVEIDIRLQKIIKRNKISFPKGKVTDITQGEFLYTGEDILMFIKKKGKYQIANLTNS